MAPGNEPPPSRSSFPPWSGSRSFRRRGGGGAPGSAPRGGGGWNGRRTRSPPPPQRLRHNRGGIHHHRPTYHPHQPPYQQHQHHQHHTYPHQQGSGGHGQSQIPSRGLQGRPRSPPPRSPSRLQGGSMHRGDHQQQHHIHPFRGEPGPPHRVDMSEHGGAGGASSYRGEGPPRGVPPHAPPYRGEHGPPLQRGEHGPPLQRGEHGPPLQRGDHGMSHPAPYRGEPGPAYRGALSGPTHRDDLPGGMRHLENGHMGHQPSFSWVRKQQQKQQKQKKKRHLLHTGGSSKLLAQQLVQPPSPKRSTSSSAMPAPPGGSVTTAKAQAPSAPSQQRTTAYKPGPLSGQKPLSSPSGAAPGTEHGKVPSLPSRPGSRPPQSVATASANAGPKLDTGSPPSLPPSLSSLSRGASSSPTRMPPSLSAPGARPSGRITSAGQAIHGSGQGVPRSAAKLSQSRPLAPLSSATAVLSSVRSPNLHSPDAKSVTQRDEHKKALPSSEPVSLPVVPRSSLGAPALTPAPTSLSLTSRQSGATDHTVPAAPVASQSTEATQPASGAGPNQKFATRSAVPSFLRSSAAATPALLSKPRPFPRNSLPSAPAPSSASGVPASASSQPSSTPLTTVRHPVASPTQLPGAKPAFAPNLLASPAPGTSLPERSAASPSHPASISPKSAAPLRSAAALRPPMSVDAAVSSPKRSSALSQPSLNLSASALVPVPSFLRSSPRPGPSTTSGSASPRESIRPRSPRSPVSSPSSPGIDTSNLVSQINEVDAAMATLRRAIAMKKEALLGPDPYAVTDTTAVADSSKAVVTDTGAAIAAKIVARICGSRAMLDDREFPTRRFLSPWHSAQQWILHQNRSLAASSVSALRHLCHDTERGLDPTLVVKLEAVPEIPVAILDHVRGVLRQRRSARIEKRRRLVQEYMSLKEAWRRRLKSARDKRSRDKREAIKERDRYLLLSTKGHSALLFSRTSSGRTSTKVLPGVNSGGQVSGVAEMDAMLADIEAEGGTPGFHEVWSKTLAVIPDQDPTYIPFDGASLLISDPIAEHHAARTINPWLNEEKLTFLDKYLAYPKNFRKIASFLEHKTTSDCSRFYFDNKLALGLKQLAKDSTALRRKGTKRAHLMALVGMRPNADDLDGTKTDTVNVRDGVAVASLTNGTAESGEVERSPPVQERHNVVSPKIAKLAERGCAETGGLDLAEGDRELFANALLEHGTDWRQVAGVMGIQGRSPSNFRDYYRRNRRRFGFDDKLAAHARLHSSSSLSAPCARTADEVADTCLEVDAPEAAGHSANERQVVVSKVAPTGTHEAEHSAIIRVANGLSSPRPSHQSSVSPSGESGEIGTSVARADLQSQSKKVKPTAIWTAEEAIEFRTHFKTYGRNWKRIAQLMAPKTPTQIKGYWRRLSCEGVHALPGDVGKVAKSEKRRQKTTANCEESEKTETVHEREENSLPGQQLVGASESDAIAKATPGTGSSSGKRDAEEAQLEVTPQRQAKRERSFNDVSASWDDGDGNKCNISNGPIAQASVAPHCAAAAILTGTGSASLRSAAVPVTGQSDSNAQDAAGAAAMVSLGVATPPASASVSRLDELLKAADECGIIDHFGGRDGTRLAAKRGDSKNSTPQDGES